MSLRGLVLAGLLAQWLNKADPKSMPPTKLAKAMSSSGPSASSSASANSALYSLSCRAP